MLATAEGDEPLTTSRNWVVRGWGFPDATTAAEAGELWRSILQVAFAKVRIAADFGDRSARGGGFTIAGLEWMRERSNVSVRSPILNDQLGITSFRRFPQPKFASLGSPTLSVTHKIADLQRAVEAAHEAVAAQRPERERVAYDLFSASFFTRDSDVRFLLLMMACETLIELNDRNPRVREHVDVLIALTKEADLSRADTDSVVGTLRWLYKESIGQGGRRLASRLEPRRYMDETPAKFFTRCYTMRSALVHVHTERPSAVEVGRRAATLEVFVQHLLSGPLIDLDL